MRSQLTKSDNSKRYETKLNALGFFVANNVTAMLAYWDKNQVCRFANNAYQEWFGKTKDEMIDKITMKELLGPLYEKNLPYILGALQGNPQTFEREIVLPSGSSRHSIANYFPDVENGEVKGFFVHVADVTPLKKLEFELKGKEQDLIELNKYKDKVISVIAHDLKNYFTINYTTIEYLISDYNNISKEEILKYLHVLEKNNSRTVYFLDELAEWVKNALNRVVYKPQKINIADEVNTVIEFLSEHLADKNISVQTFFGARSGFADATMFRSVMRNLISNAIKFSPKGAEIVVRTVFAQNEIICSVKDNGVGISEAVVEKIMSGSNYESAYGTKGEKGFGLGLSLTKEFIERNKGKFWIESTAGKGSTFYFTIPTADAS